MGYVNGARAAASSLVTAALTSLQSWSTRPWTVGDITTVEPALHERSRIRSQHPD